MKTLISMAFGAIAVVAVDKGIDLIRNRKLEETFEKEQEETELESELREKCDALAEKLWSQWSFEDA